MKIVKKTLRMISIGSSVAAAALFIVFFFLYGTSPDFDYLLVAVFTVGVAPAAVASIIHNRWKNKMVKAMPDFLRDLGTSLQTGVTIQVALENASKRNYGPLTDELEIMLSHMSWGMNFEEAMTELSKSVDLPLITRSTVLILEASRHGGNLYNIFNSTANYMDNVNTWDMRRKTQTMPYIGIFYFSVAVFLFITILISQLIFVQIGEWGGEVPLIRPMLTTIQARRLFMHTSLLESFFGGLLAGKINESSFIAGLKHSMVLAIMSGAAFFIFFR